MIEKNPSWTRNRMLFADLSQQQEQQGRKAEMTGPNDKWSKPVRLDLANSGRLEVSSPFEALIYLTEDWPAHQDLRFVKARSACRGALAGHRSVEEARTEFEAAAEEARQQFRKGRH
jgi:hypothetical protein